MNPILRFMLLLAVMALAHLQAPRAFAGDENHPYAPGELLVKFEEGTVTSQAESIATLYGAVEITPFRLSHVGGLSESPMDRWYHVKLAPSVETEQALEQFANDPTIERVELNYEVSIDLAPNDPDFPFLWGLHNTGQNGGTPDADIDAQEAWDIQTGTGSVLVAVIDTGVDYNHLDLTANIWTNLGELPDNGIDDDGNGYVDDVHGYDFRNGDGDPLDDHSHGTHVAGTIAAVGDNGVGVVGVSWNATIMALKFIGASGFGWNSDAIRAILYATDMGAMISNNSWGGGPFSWALRDAIAEANDVGVLFVAAAGNSSTNTDSIPFYPSSYNLPNILSVAATDRHDELASFSNYGPTSVDLGAPGVSILSTMPNGGYNYKNGTSMAAPHASGAAALIWAQQPSLEVSGVKALIMNTVDPLESLSGKVLSGGRLNVHQALPSAADLVLEYDEIEPGEMETYEASNSITAPNGFIIKSNANVVFRAGNIIRLLPGFEAKEGSEFLAEIDPAPSP